MLGLKTFLLLAAVALVFADTEKGDSDDSELVEEKVDLLTRADDSDTSALELLATLKRSIETEAVKRQSTWNGTGRKRQSTWNGTGKLQSLLDGLAKRQSTWNGTGRKRQSTWNGTGKLQSALNEVAKRQSTWNGTGRKRQSTWNGTGKRQAS